MSSHHYMQVTQTANDSHGGDHLRFQKSILILPRLLTEVSNTASAVGLD